MSKRNYTHIQMLHPEIEAMLEQGKRNEKLQSIWD